MGNLGVNCCSQGETNQKSECKVPQGNIENSDANIMSIPTLPKIPTLPNVSSVFEFILSENYYLLLLSKISQYDIIIKLTNQLNPGDFVVLLSKLFDWIHICDSKNNKLIKKTKMDIDLGIKNILVQLNQNKNYGNGFKNNICLALGEVSLIAQYIKFLGERKKNTQAYQENFWKDKNMESFLKLTVYNCIFYLVKCKENGNINLLTKKSNNSYTNSSETMGEGPNIAEKTAKIVNKFLQSISDKLINN